MASSDTPKGAAAVEKFTLQIQGRGVQIKVRIPGWAIAPIWGYAKASERG